MKELSVIIPTYNEEKIIAASLKDIAAYFSGKGFDYEILVSDGGSRDGTRAAVRDFSAENPRVRLLTSEERGKGLVSRKGVLASRGKLVLLTDADLSVPVTEFDKLRSAINDQTDIAIGSKSLPASRTLVRQPRYREVLARFMNRLIRLCYLPGIRDTQCGFKLFKGEVARELFNRQRINGYLFDVEVLCLARKKGHRIAEIPVVCSHSRESKVRILRDLPQVMIDFLRVRG